MRCISSSNGDIPFTWAWLYALGCYFLGLAMGFGIAKMLQ